MAELDKLIYHLIKVVFKKGTYGSFFQPPLFASLTLPRSPPSGVMRDSQLTLWWRTLPRSGKAKLNNFTPKKEPT